MFDIRTATAADAETLLRFIQALADYEREPDAVRTDAGTLRAQLSSAQPPFECLLAERDGEALGFALYFQSYSTWRGRPGLWLEDLFVPEAQRGQGVGRALLTKLAAIARERDCARLEWSVLDWNAPALAFYGRLGAKAQADWTTYRLTDAALTQLASG